MLDHVTVLPATSTFEALPTAIPILVSVSNESWIGIMIQGLLAGATIFTLLYTVNVRRTDQAPSVEVFSAGGETLVLQNTSSNYASQVALDYAVVALVADSIAAEGVAFRYEVPALLNSEFHPTLAPAAECPIDMTRFIGRITTAALDDADVEVAEEAPSWSRQYRTRCVVSAQVRFRSTGGRPYNGPLRYFLFRAWVEYPIDPEHPSHGVSRVLCTQISRDAAHEFAMDPVPK